MKRTHFLSLLLAVGFMASASGVFAQSNVIRLAPFKFATRFGNIAYERQVAPKISVGLGASYFFPVNIIDGVVGIDQSQYFTGSFVPEDGQIKGFTITPEARFYLNKKEGLRGFYLSPFLRYLNYSVDASGVYTSDTQEASDLSIKYGFGGVGGGLTLGAQWILNDIFVIDWNIGGGGAVTGISIEGTANGPLQDDIQGFVDEVNAQLAGIPGGVGKPFTLDGNNLKGRIGGLPWPILRSSLSFGVAF
ncbi:MAG: DUF3575 domain-containing protein [Bacteroidetes bacterium]|nr:MAG: DUF3575 domain-containing protein [Bacteroidota bacterium]